MKKSYYVISRRTINDAGVFSNKRYLSAAAKIDECANDIAIVDDAVSFRKASELICRPGKSASYARVAYRSQASALKALKVARMPCKVSWRTVFSVERRYDLL